MHVEFKDMCSSSMTYGREDYYDKIVIKDDTGTHTFDANRCFSISVPFRYPKRYYKCSTFVGGFVDSAFFVKSEIIRLAPEHMREFVENLTQATDI